MKPNLIVRHHFAGIESGTSTNGVTTAENEDAILEGI